MQITHDAHWILSQEENEIIADIKIEFSKYRTAVLRIKQIEKLYLYLTGVGISVGFDESGNITIKDWNEMISDREKTKDFVLRTSIALFDEFPQCFTNRIFYPRAFKLVYDKACYRKVVIKEYERFLTEVLSVKNGDRRYLSLAYVTKADNQTLEFDNRISTNERPEYKLSFFLSALGEMYLAEYRYDDVKTIMDWHRRNKINSFAYGLAQEYFRRTGSFDQGIEYFKECLNEFPPEDEKLFQQAISTMNLWRNFKPYKARPRKEDSFSIEVLKLSEGRENC